MSDVRGILADSIDRLLADLVERTVLDDAERGVWPAALWDALEEGGLTMPLVGEDRGGAGGTWVDAYVLLHAAGRHAAPVPLAETILASWLLGTAGLEVPRGPLTVAPLSAADGLVLDGDRVRGRASRVPWGAAARHVVVALPGAGGLRVALVATSAAQIEPGQNIAREPRDGLTFADASAVAVADTALAPDALWCAGARVRAVQMAGALAGILALSVRYAGERVQFGRAIGAFQAIQHQLAVLAEEAAAAAVAAEVACAAADRGDAAFETAVAKVRAGDAVRVGAAIAHQVHGAIGFTYEHALQFLTRRLWAWAGEVGGASHWAARLGDDALARGRDGLWPWITAR